MVLPKRLEINIPPAVTAVAEAAVGHDAVMRAVASAVLQVGGLSPHPLIYLWRPRRVTLTGFVGREKVWVGVVDVVFLNRFCQVAWFHRAV